MPCFLQKRDYDFIILNDSNGYLELNTCDPEYLGGVWDYEQRPDEEELTEPEKLDIVKEEVKDYGPLAREFAKQIRPKLKEKDTAPQVRALVKQELESFSKERKRKRNETALLLLT